MESKGNPSIKFGEATADEPGFYPEINM